MVEVKYRPKISPRNEVFADKIRTFAKKYSIVGVLDVEGLPAPQFQRIRASLKKNAEVLIVKKNLIKLVLGELEKTYPGIKNLENSMQGIVGLVFTNDNPFTLYKFVKKNKSSAPAKAGSIALGPIVVPAGPTSFAPGPIIGELGAFKIKAGINAGKVEIKEDSPVAKEGDVISGALAAILTRLGIEPMEVGLNIKSIYEDGTIYTRSVLDVDEDAILADMRTLASNAAKLAYGLNYVTKDNISMFIGKAARDSLGLGVGIAYPAAGTLSKLFAKANAQMSGVASQLPEDIRPAGLATAAPVAAAGQDSANANEEPQKEEKKPEEDASASLGGFF
ncbi:MAG: 50S ribosomal protein L10 [Candidatus Woesearchaeota archaeon]|jgi:large subunit ribosomal protein L10|nr:50S ribosomal protein L10 [Candidatus Woesearchaeota archaeon]